MRVHRHLHRGWVLAVVGLLVLGAVAVVPRLGFTTNETPIWNDRALDVTPAPIQTPNWVALAKQLKPAVVNISTKRVEDETPESNGPPSMGPDDPFQQFFRRFGQRGPRTVRSLGSGFIINQNGFVLTNNHVVDKASEIHVRLVDGRDVPGKVVGRDPKTDLALVKIEVSGLSVVPVGDSSKLEVGAPVMAIGNPFGLEQTVTTGIVSATGRVIGEGPYDDFIQTDASINPGNSGGPLINAQGQAVGINTAIFSRTGGSVGIGFAIPVNLAKPVVTQLAQSGHVERGWLGVSIQPVTPDLAKSFGLQNTHGALVASVSEGSPAAKAGLKAGDVITEYNGREVGRTADLPRAVAETPVGRDVPISVLRDGKTVKLTAKIAQLEETGQELAAAQSNGEKPVMGVDVESLTPMLAQQLGISDTKGVIVRAVRDGGPAANAGIQAGDVIVEVDRHPVANVTEMKTALDKRAKGAPVLLLVHRDGSSLYAAVQL